MYRYGVESNIIELFLHYERASTKYKVGLSFLPICDQGDIRIKFEFPTNYNLETTQKLVQEAAHQLEKFNFIKGMVVQIGNVNAASGQVGNAVYLAQINLKTTEKTERKETIYQLQDMIRKELSHMHNCRITLSVPATFGGAGAEIL